MENPFPYLTSAYGLFQTIKADIELNKLSKETIPTYSLTPESKAVVDMGKFGYSPQEAAVFHSNVNKNTNAAYRTAIERSGNSFGGAVNALNTSRALSAENEFAKNDASLMRSNAKTAAGITQGIQDKNTSVVLNDYNARQRAWGQSKQAGINNMFMGLATSSGLFKKADETNGVDDTNAVSAAGLLSTMDNEPRVTFDAGAGIGRRSGWGGLDAREGWGGGLGKYFKVD